MPRGRIDFQGVGKFSKETRFRGRGRFGCGQANKSYAILGKHEQPFVKSMGELNEPGPPSPCFRR
jgi:hypothetical protein